MAFSKEQIIGLLKSHSQDDIKNELARRRLLPFIEQVYNGEYEAGWVHKEICAKLEKFYQDVKAGKSPRLMIFMPPRHGKSEIASRMFPAWCLGRDPDMSIISTAYSTDLSSRMNRDVQRIIDNPDYKAIFPNTNLYGKNIRSVANGAYLRNSDIFEVVNHKGVYRSAGVGTGITGMGADILIIDDPVKDNEEARSLAYQQRAIDWYSTTSASRLSPKSGVLLIMTRWNTEDLAGKLLKAMKDGGDQWEIINYPALSEEDELMRPKDEALHPARYDRDRLLAIKKQLYATGQSGVRAWNSLYQQHPVNAEGNMVPRTVWQFYNPLAIHDPASTFDTIIMSVDATFKDQKKNDWVVAQVWALKGANAYLLDQVRGHLNITATINTIRTLKTKHPYVSGIYIEDAANGPAIIQLLKGKIPGIQAVTADKSKEARVNQILPFLEAGNVFLPDPENCTWQTNDSNVNDFIEEFAAFPEGKNDDQVDGCTQALAKLFKGKKDPVARVIHNGMRR